MLSTFFDSLTKLITDPGKQIVAGAALAGIIWKFFDKVEEKLSDDTKLEIARWLRVKSFETGIIADEAKNWPRTFAQIFDRVFGTKHISWKCFFRSCLASYAAIIILFVIAYQRHTSAPQLLQRLFDPNHHLFIMYMFLYSVVGNLIPDYVSL